MSPSISFEWNQEKLVLLPEKAVWLPEHDALLIADLHFGKTAHFRKNGLAFPANSAAQDFHLLQALLKSHPCKRVYFLGDLFHSEENHEWDTLLDVLASFQKTSFFLIPGNHDLVSIPKNRISNFLCTAPSIKLGHLTLAHDPQDSNKGDYTICGHIHPGYRLQGKARQSIMLPAFYIHERLLLLPAFGALTGLVSPHISKGSSVAIIGPTGVHWVPGRKFGT